MGSSCAQSASQNHILLRQFTIYFNSTLNFKGLKILGTRRNDISVVFTMGQVLEEFLLMGKIRESLEEVGDDCRLEFNPDFTKFLCDLLPTWLEREIQYTVEATSSPECSSSDSSSLLSNGSSLPKTLTSARTAARKPATAVAHVTSLSLIASVKDS